MHLVVGLGNPGKKYERTRHNIGFMVVEHLARTHGMPDFSEKFSGLWSKGEIATASERVSLAVLMPSTFMNRSGDSVQPAAAFLKVSASSILVVQDELDLPWGQLRVKVGGGHAGHNGLRSVIERLGTPDFSRLRVGIGRPSAEFRGSVADYVLQSLGGVECGELPLLLNSACHLVESVLTKGAASVAAQAAPKPGGGTGKPGAKRS